MVARHSWRVWNVAAFFEAIIFLLLWESLLNVATANVMNMNPCKSPMQSWDLSPCGQNGKFIFFLCRFFECVCVYNSDLTSAAHLLLSIQVLSNFSFFILQQTNNMHSLPFEDPWQNNTPPVQPPLPPPSLLIKLWNCFQTKLDSFSSAPPPAFIPWLHLCKHFWSGVKGTETATNKTTCHFSQSH